MYLVLRLVAGNLDEVSLQDAVRALPALFVVTGLVLVALRLPLGSFRVAGLGTTLVLLVVFTFEPLVGRLAPAAASSILVVGLAVLALAFLGWAFLVLHRLGSRTRPLTRFANVMTGLLVLFAAGQLAWFAWRTEAHVLANPDPEDEIIQAGAAESLPLQPPAGPLPDIYLILLDGYARGDVLQGIYGHDNTAFVSALESEGFQVSPSSFSNYLSTRLVLPSLLNMRYLDILARQYGRDYPNVRPLVRDIQHNQVVASLRGLGYRIVNIRSSVAYAGLADPDEVLHYDGSWWEFNPFETALVDMTPLGRWRQNWSWAQHASPEVNRHREVRHAMQQLEAQAAHPGPKFVFAHVMAPHDPFVFAPDGQLRVHDTTMYLFHEYDENERLALHRSYADQVTALNDLVLQAVRRLRADSDVPPIIVLLGDHGLRLYLRDLARDTCLQESFAILYALHLPGVHGDVPIPRTPVNTFRLIFDTYFGTRLGELPDKAYFAHRKTGYYSYQDVTSQVETCTMP